MSFIILIRSSHRILFLFELADACVYVFVCLSVFGSACICPDMRASSGMHVHYVRVREYIIFLFVGLCMYAYADEFLLVAACVFV